MSGGTGLWMRKSRGGFRQRSPDVPRLSKIPFDYGYSLALGYAFYFHSSVYSVNDDFAWPPR